MDKQLAQLQRNIARIRREIRVLSTAERIQASVAE
jgi:hypothetical protein